MGKILEKSGNFVSPEKWEPYSSSTPANLLVESIIPEHCWGLSSCHCSVQQIGALTVSATLAWLKDNDSNF